MDDDVSAVLTELRGPSWGNPTPRIVTNGAAPAKEIDAQALRRATADSIRALQLIRSYRVRGHLEADLDPLGLDKRGHHPELDYRSYGFAEVDLDREIFIGSCSAASAPLAQSLATVRLAV
jgi:2-oxoglutarate dehydrogenase E1 component